MSRAHSDILSRARALLFLLTKKCGESEGTGGRVVGVGFDEQSPPESGKAQRKERRETESPGQGVKVKIERALLKHTSRVREATL